MVTSDSPPRIKPTMAEARSISRRAILEAFMIAPANTNSGIASKGNEVAPSYMVSATFGSAIAP